MKKENVNFMKNGKKKLNTLDKYIIFCLSVLVIYTISALVVFVIVGVESTTLTLSVFGSFSGEMLLCFLIKKFKLHEEIKLLKQAEKEEDL